MSDQENQMDLPKLLASLAAAGLVVGGVLVVGPRLEQPEPYKTIIDRIKVLVHGETDYWRTLREKPFTSGLQVFPKNPNFKWQVGAIRNSDLPLNKGMDGNYTLILSMYYAEHKIPEDFPFLGWGDDQVVICDFVNLGAYQKDTYVDDKLVWRYTPSNNHCNIVLCFNLKTGQAVNVTPMYPP